MKMGEKTLKISDYKKNLTKAHQNFISDQFISSQLSLYLFLSFFLSSFFTLNVSFWGIISCSNFKKGNRRKDAKCFLFYYFFSSHWFYCNVICVFLLLLDLNRSSIHINSFFIIIFLSSSFLNILLYCTFFAFFFCFLVFLAFSCIV